VEILIDTTAQAYATAAYDVFHADCVTLNPYMGWDSIQPFVTGNYGGKGAFILCKTSNKSSKEVQDVSLLNGKTNYEHVIELVNRWNAQVPYHGSLGLVAGATDIPALRLVRSINPTAWILCPGVGAQGGDAKSVCDAALRKDGSGVLISVSRQISKSTNMSETAKMIRDEINVIRSDFLQKQLSENNKSEANELKIYQKEFIQFALSEKVLQFGSFQLKSGRISPYFFNAGLFCHGKSLSILSRAYAQAIHDQHLEFDVIFGPAYKGIPLVTAFAIAWYELFGESKDICYNRKEAKDHGEGGLLVGAPIKGRRVLIIDDVITAGTAIREAVNLLYASEAKIVATVVCLDRQERANDQSPDSAIQQVEKEYGFPVISIIQLSHLIAFILQQISEDDNENNRKLLEQIQQYRSQYGV